MHDAAASDGAQPALSCGVPPAAGYAHARYAQSMLALGTPRHLPACDGWVIERPIADSGQRDAMGCYPRFFCRDWNQLAVDVPALADELVAFSLVTDPFGCPAPEGLREVFDRVVHFKNHFVVELDQPLARIVKPSHLANVRKAQRSVRVQICERPLDRLDEWMDLFSVLVQRRSISGLRRPSRESFAAQFAVPGLVMFEAHADGELVGLDLWYVQGDVAYGHVVAFSERGYRLRAAYATKWAVLSHFHSRLRWIDLGGGSGLSMKDDGLVAFKSGWATAIRPVYFCGKVLQPVEYRRLVTAAGRADSHYFPAYRHGEFE